MLMMVVALLAVAASTARGDGLGVGIEILATQDETPGQLGANSELWFAAQPGGTASRAFALISTSDLVQEVNFEIRPLVVVDGTPTIDLTTLSETAQWATFEPARLELQPGERREVTMTYAIPPDAAAASYEAYLRILVSSAAAVELDPDAKVQAVVKGALAVRKSIWLGVGDTETLVSDFEIRGVAGWLTDAGERAVRVLVANVGQTPIRPTGSVQLADAVFPDRRFGPHPFRMGTLDPGDVRYAEAVVDPAVTDGRWKVYVEVQQGNVKKSEVYDVDLVFDRSLDEISAVRSWGVRAGAVAVALALVLIGIRIARGGRGRVRRRGGRRGLSVADREAMYRERLTAQRPAERATEAGRPAMVRPSRTARARRGGASDVRGGIPRTEPADVAARLRELRTMLDEGLITEDEYERKRGEILGRL